MRCDVDLAAARADALERDRAAHGERDRRALAQLITALENGTAERRCASELRARAAQRTTPVARHHRHRRRRQVARSPTSWSGASASTRTTACSIAVISIDPSRRKTRRRAARRPHPHERDRTAARSVYMRSLATRDAGSEICAGAAATSIAACKAAGFDLVDRRDLRHRPGRRGDRAARRRARCT